MFGTTESLERINAIKESFMEEMIFELRFEGGVKGVDSMGRTSKQGFLIRYMSAH